MLSNDQLLEIFGDDVIQIYTIGEPSGAQDEGLLEFIECNSPFHSSVDGVSVSSSLALFYGMQKGDGVIRDNNNVVWTESEAETFVYNIEANILLQYVWSNDATDLTDFYGRTTSINVAFTVPIIPTVGVGTSIGFTDDNIRINSIDITYGVSGFSIEIGGAESWTWPK